MHNELLEDKQQVSITINGKERFTVDKTSEESKKTWKYSEVDTLDIKIVTVEEANLKGKLTVVLDKSLAEDNSDIRFNIGASGGTIVNNAHYKKGSEKIYDNYVDVKQNIVVSSESVSVLANKAIKIEIEKDGKLAEIYYTSEKEFNKIISAWNGRKNSSEIKVTISLVEVEKHKSDSGENYSVEVQFADADKKIIAEGDIVEGSRKVIVRITPSNGYYVDFAKKTYNENGVYQRTMKYSDYQKEIENIINDNPIKKMLTVTLSSSVPYQCGTVSYKADGEDYEAGTYSFKEGTEISMTLKINADSDYGILNDGLFSFINKYKEEETKKISITKEMDNTILSVKDYVTIEKKGD